MEAVARLGAGATAKEISVQLGLPRATAYRLLNLLVEEEYLVRVHDLSGFALGRKVAELAHLVRPARPPRAVRELVDDLRGRVRGGVHLVGYAGGLVRILDEDPDFPLSDSARLERDPEASALGRLLLAERYAVPDAASGGSSGGFAAQTGSFAPDRACLAVPIRDADGTLVAGLGAAVPAARAVDPDVLLVPLRETAARLGPLLA
nr:helix-turn-helix domain-containing protein [Agromyces seonyuensis]